MVAAAGFFHGKNPAIMEVGLTNQKTSGPNPPFRLDFLEDHPQLGSSTYLVTVTAIYGSVIWKGSHKTPRIGDGH